jgi:hypothetical protein
MTNLETTIGLAELTLLLDRDGDSPRGYLEDYHSWHTDRSFRVQPIITGEWPGSQYNPMQHYRPR